ncbi:L-histidine N(alpha)-methyltransferase [Aliidiomarina minuta]|uniref:L-histidine N(Alpha)-methyltransferase n=1 Tax=Aliidiomarina minuta TaxID=880057 RepID=A0A432W7G5_9GAMM|nr:L-histidine N(alpha)-methyltransferase [Aliidiomarina minuta]RUO25982.1 L-histidine N(alpha)-methyltransferase [Aliidiomarina minuta]
MHEQDSPLKLDSTLKQDSTLNEFYEDVVRGLSQSQKTLSPKYFYDAQGSRYFDQICQLPEYYPYRTELKLLPTVARELNSYFQQQAIDELNVVEFGAGSLHKIKPLLEHIPAIRHFTAIDISGEHLDNACQELQKLFPDLDIQAVQGDFTQPVSLHSSQATRLGFFPGSTIGNLTPEEAVEFLRSARQTLGTGSYMLLGVDSKKDTSILHQAYNDSQGITALFNKNILQRINRELGADFELSNFEHQAVYNSAKGRIEMHLRSTSDQKVQIGDNSFTFKQDESIHTENSYKYTTEEFSQLSQGAGWVTEEWWLADNNMFAVTLLRC